MLKPEGLDRFDLARLLIRGLMRELFAADEDLLLSSTETGLCVWNTPCSWTSVDLLCSRNLKGSCFGLGVAPTFVCLTIRKRDVSKNKNHDLDESRGEIMMIPNIF